MSESDEKLNVLYRQRKANVKPPESIRHAAMNAAKKTEQQPSLGWLSFGKQLHLITACIGIVVLGLLVKHTLQAPPQPTAMETHIETLSASPEAGISTLSKSADLAVAQQAHSRRQLTMAIHHKEVAQVANTQGIWELRMCNRESITLSPELMAELAQQNALTDGIQHGDFVQIAFAENGLVISIEKPLTPLEC